MFVNCKFVFLHKLPTTNMKKKLWHTFFFTTKKNISILLISRIIFIYWFTLSISCKNENCLTELANYKILLTVRINDRRIKKKKTNKHSSILTNVTESVKITDKKKELLVSKSNIITHRRQYQNFFLATFVRHVDEKTKICYLAFETIELKKKIKTNQHFTISMRKKRDF